MPCRIQFPKASRRPAAAQPSLEIIMTVPRDHHRLPPRILGYWFAFLARLAFFHLSTLLATVHGDGTWKRGVERGGAVTDGKKLRLHADGDWFEVENGGDSCYRYIDMISGEVGSGCAGSILEISVARGVNCGENWGNLDLFPFFFFFSKRVKTTRVL